MLLYILYYIFVLLILLTIYFDGFRANHRHYKSVFKCIYITLGLLMAFRYGVGNDTPGYMQFYNIVPPLDKLSTSFLLQLRSQPLFAILCSACKTITNNFVIIQILQAFLFSHSFYLLMNRLGLCKFIFLYIFYCFVWRHELSALRECFALSFCFYGFLYYLDNKYKKYYTLVTVGFLFHSGVAIFFLFPLLKFFRTLNTRNFLILTIGVIAIFATLTTIQEYLLQSFISTAEIASRAKIEQRDIKYTTIILYVVQIAFLYYYSINKGHNKLSINKGHNKYNINKGQNKRPDLIYSGLFYVIFSFIGVAYLVIAFRYTAHFALFYYYIIADSLSNMKRDTLIKVVFLTFVLYVPTQQMIVARDDRGNILEYYSVFDSDKDAMDRIIRDAALPLFLH